MMDFLPQLSGMHVCFSPYLSHNAYFKHRSLASSANVHIHVHVLVVVRMTEKKKFLVIRHSIRDKYVSYTVYPHDVVEKKSLPSHVHDV